MNRLTAKTVADAVVALRQARTKADAMDAGEAKVIRLVQLDRSTPDLARAVQRATARRK
jgi:hypothetical protein